MRELLTSLEKLRQYGFSPNSVLDLGAYKGEWSTILKRHMYPKAIFHMVEPIDYPELKMCGIPYTNALLFSEKTKVPWYEKQNTGDSIFKESTSIFKDIEPMFKNTETLDSLFPEGRFDFIKIDCQGSEIPILIGGQKIIVHTEAILLELPFAGIYNKSVPDYLTHLRYMDSIGFLPYDIVELHRKESVLIQIDVLFLRKTSEVWKKVQTMIES